MPCWHSSRTDRTAGCAGVGARDAGGQGPQDVGKFVYSIFEGRDRPREEASQNTRQGATGARGQGPAADGEAGQNGARCCLRLRPLRDGCSTVGIVTITLICRRSVYRYTGGVVRRSLWGGGLRYRAAAPAGAGTRTGSRWLRKGRSGARAVVTPVKQVFARPERGQAAGLAVSNPRQQFVESVRERQR